ncbi:response regulator [Tolypothrix sp. PCC 7910]|uniref:response regulator n=1 Tax=Tolypothrix sp. PCC 7910 TaxID=2099387 RepID=UPI0014279EAB|nr:response regulator [Tolypothrix sp. PCC 7910]QIR39701.1 response regulator [Tolypothrix sp. PCC 7910]
MMLDMNGIASFQALQSDAETEQIPVILLTAIAQTAEKHQFHDLGFCGVITKPLNSLELKILYW